MVTMSIVRSPKVIIVAARSLCQIMVTMVMVYM